MFKLKLNQTLHREYHNKSMACIVLSYSILKGVPWDWSTTRLSKDSSEMLTIHKDSSWVYKDF